MLRSHSQLRIAWDLMRSEREGPAGIDSRRRNRLTSLLRHAHSQSRFYRQRLPGATPGPDALPDLPPVSKSELMGAFDDWVTDPAVTFGRVSDFVADPAQVGTSFLGRYFVCTTSGTTGLPGVFVHDAVAVALYRALVVARVDRRWMSPRQLLELTLRRFRWASVIGTGGHFGGVGWMEAERHRSRWRSRSFRVFSLRKPLPQIVDELNDFDPAMLTAYPSALQLLVAEQRAGRLHLHPVVVETAGESAEPLLQADAADAFGCPVHDAYACSEFLFLGFDCPQGWIHLNADWMILEPVDSDFSPTPAGRASHTVLLTNLANHVQPLIRYDLGDSVLARPDPCPCGSPLPAIRVSGRKDETMNLIGSRGTRVSIPPLAWATVVDSVPGVRRCQLVQTGPGTIEVRLESDSGPAVWPWLSSALMDHLKTQGAPDVLVRRSPWPPAADPNSGKFRRVVVEHHSAAPPR